MAKIHLQTLGCRLNQAESERMARTFKLAGHEIVPSAEEAEYRIVNSCTVTKNAGDDSRQAAFRKHADQKIIVTGCHSEMHPDDFKQADLIIPNADKERLASLVLERFGMDGYALGMDTQSGQAETLYPLTLKNTRAFVKIQDGCNMRCSFCLTTLARGHARSRKADEIISEIKMLADQGCREAVLTGVHAGSYGEDIQSDLGWLIDQILSRTSIPRLRLSSLEPWNFKDDWVSLWPMYGNRLCRHLHMSLQSGSDTILPRMRRNYDAETYAGKIEAARAIPGMAVTTDIIVGFPGETDAEHRESLDFVTRMNFAGAHIFTYSPRPGTDAAQMPDQIKNAVKKKRYHEMKAVVAKSESAFRTEALGQTLDVLWEKQEGDCLSGLSDNYLRIFTPAALAQPNTLQPVLLRREQDGKLMGEPMVDTRAPAWRGCRRD